MLALPYITEPRDPSGRLARLLAWGRRMMDTCPGCVAFYSQTWHVAGSLRLHSGPVIALAPPRRCTVIHNGNGTTTIEAAGLVTTIKGSGPLAVDNGRACATGCGMPAASGDRYCDGCGSAHDRSGWCS